MRSYLSDRSQFVIIDGAKSDIIYNHPCSVIQGSKIAGTFYSLYTNEIPLIYRVLHSNMMSAIMKRQYVKYNNIAHRTFNFVDDSNSIIGFQNTQQMSNYCENYFQVLESFYNSNKLIINSDKIKLCINSPVKYLPQCNNFHFQAG